MNIDDLNEQMDLRPARKEDYETIGGFVFGLFGRQPNEGESVEYEDVVFTVEKSDAGRLHKIRVVHIPAEEPADSSNDRETVHNHHHGNGNGNGGKK